MAKYSQKQGGKEVGAAAVYAAPHTMSGKAGAESKPRKTGAEVMNEMNPSIAGITKSTRADKADDGIKIRGTGAATKGVKARGPMA